MSRRVATAALLLAAACARPSLPAPPAGVDAIAVARPGNATGRDLVVAGRWALERLVRRGDVVTVPDVLAAGARTQLAAAGFRTRDLPGGAPATVDQAVDAARRAGIAGAVLVLVVRRWEPDEPQHQFVDVALDAALADVATGRIVWQARRGPHYVPTPGAPGAAYASEMAARREIASLLAGWRPGAAR